MAEDLGCLWHKAGSTELLSGSTRGLLLRPIEHVNMQAEHGFERGQAGLGLFGQLTG